MTVNIVVFIDCYSTIYIENNMAFITYIFSKKNKRRMRILGALYFLSFLAGKLRHFERSFEKLIKNWRMRIILSFLAGKLKILNRGLASKKYDKITNETSEQKLDQI